MNVKSNSLNQTRLIETLTLNFKNHMAECALQKQKFFLVQQTQLQLLQLYRGPKTHFPKLEINF